MPDTEVGMFVAGAHRPREILVIAATELLRDYLGRYTTRAVQ